MAYTYRANLFNSTPFSSCCRTASMDSRGRPDDHCHKCGEKMTHDEDGLSQARRQTPPGCCLMCRKPVGNPAISGNCHC